jgi:tyrosyl-tRNA synthetase
MATLDASQKFALITNNLAEVLNPELIKQVLVERDLKVYWGTENLLYSRFGTKQFPGTAPTGRPHCGCM